MDFRNTSSKTYRSTLTGKPGTIPSAAMACTGFIAPLGGSLSNLGQRFSLPSRGDMPTGRGGCLAEKTPGRPNEVEPTEQKTRPEQGALSGNR